MSIRKPHKTNISTILRQNPGTLVLPYASLVYSQRQSGQQQEIKVEKNVRQDNPQPKLDKRQDDSPTAAQTKHPAP